MYVMYLQVPIFLYVYLLKKCFSRPANANLIGLSKFKPLFEDGSSRAAKLAASGEMRCRSVVESFVGTRENLVLSRLD